MAATHRGSAGPITTAVRQGGTLGVMRWVLAASLLAAVIGLVVARLLA